MMCLFFVFFLTPLPSATVLGLAFFSLAILFGRGPVLLPEHS